LEQQVMPLTNDLRNAIDAVLNHVPNQLSESTWINEDRRIWRAKCTTLANKLASAGDKFAVRFSQLVDQFDKIDPEGPAADKYRLEKREEINIELTEYKRSHEVDVAKRDTRMKLTCLKCQAHAWAEANVPIVCGDCQARMIFRTDTSSVSKSDFVTKFVHLPVSSVAKIDAHRKEKSFSDFLQQLIADKLECDIHGEDPP
jgi:hypothetical protein